MVVIDDLLIAAVHEVDLDAGHAHLVLGGDSGGVLELGRDLVGLLEGRDPVDEERERRADGEGVVITKLIITGISVRRIVALHADQSVIAVAAPAQASDLQDQNSVGLTYADTADLALHPDFDRNRYVYISYTKPLDEKRRVASTYNRLLADVPGLRLPVELNWAKNVYWMYGIKLGDGKYATLEELAAENLLPGGTEQRGYTYTAQIRATGFTVTATPTDPAKRDWPTLEITETMQVTQR